MKNLHKKMFSKTWRWAGQYRLSAKNIGIMDYWQIPVEVKKLLNDIEFQIESHTYDIDQMATRFHHRLVSIHPFSNGNGRHARLMTDLLLESLEKPQFTWGSKSLIDQNETRGQYIAALKTADKGDYLQLLSFVRR